MSQVEPWAVRCYRGAACVLGDLANEAGDTFAALYREASRRGGAAAVLGLTLRAFADLARGALVAVPIGVFAALDHDLRWAWRTLWLRPGVSAVIITSIALAIGANTAAFSVVNAFLLRPWGQAGSENVVRLREDYARPGQAADVRGFTMASFGAWQRENTVFAAMAAATGSSATMVVDGRPERVAAGVVSANFFDVLGFRPAIGRTFTAEEDTPARRDAVILGDAIWRRRFGADPQVIGRTVRLNTRIHTIVGVMPRGLKHPYQSDLWVPLGYQEDGSNTTGIYVPARLKAGVTIEQANAEMDAMAARLWEANPAPDRPSGAQVTPLRPEMLGRLTRVLYALAGTALLVLLIAVANVANLLLARSLEQRTEAAVRTALGASRVRLVRQFLTSGLLLSALGGVMGVLLTFWSVGRLVALSPLYGAGEFDIEPRLDALTLTFTIMITVLTGVAFGVVPAIAIARARVSDVLRGTGRSRTLSRTSRHWLQGLVVVELALAFVLLVGAGVVGQGLLALRRTPWGVERQDVGSFVLAVPPSRYPERAQQAAFVDRVLERVATLPSVASVAATSSAPFFPGTSLAGFSIEHRESPQRGFFLTHSRAVTPRYFETMGVPLVAGRAFSEADTAAAPPVVIVSQSFAQRYWPSQPAIGQRVKRGRIEAPTPWMEVVGVVGNLRENPSDTVPANDAWYLPYQQPTAGGIAELTYLIKTPQSGSTLQLVHGAVLELDPEVPVFDAMTMEERFARFTSTERLTAHLTTILAGLGVFLAAVGVYAVLAFSVRRRLPELGIRSALGARPIDIRRTVVRESSRLIAVGVAAGALVSLLLRPWLDPDLFAVGVSGTLAAVLAAGGTVLAAAASTVVPAARASRVDPLRAMAER